MKTGNNNTSSSRKGLNKKRNPGSPRRPGTLPAINLDVGMCNNDFRSPWDVTYPHGLIGYPDRLRTTLKYSQLITFTGSATPAAQVFAMNNCFDPDVTGSGHQPSYWDSYTAVYNRYLVKSFCAVLDFETESTSIPINVAAIYSDSDVSSQNVQYMRECKYSKADTLGLANGNKSVVRLKMPEVSLQRIMGQSELESDANLYALATGGPVDVCYLIIKMSASDSSTTFTARVNCTLLYDIVFKDLNPAYAS